MQRIFEITRERIAASQEEATRTLVRNNEMLIDEVEMLRDEIRRLRGVIYGPAAPTDRFACEGCIWWDEYTSVHPQCENKDTPDRWRSPAQNGGLSGCPNHTPQRARHTLKTALQIELLRYKDGIRHIDTSRSEGYITQDEAHSQKNRLADIYANHLARLVEIKVLFGSVRRSQHTLQEARSK